MNFITNKKKGKCIVHFNENEQVKTLVSITNDEWVAVEMVGEEEDSITLCMSAEQFAQLKAAILAEPERFLYS